MKVRRVFALLMSNNTMLLLPLPIPYLHQLLPMLRLLLLQDAPAPPLTPLTKAHVPLSTPPTSSRHDHNTVHEYIGDDNTLPSFPIDHLMSTKLTAPVESHNSVSHLFVQYPLRYEPPTQPLATPPPLQRTFDSYEIPRPDISYFCDHDKVIVFLADGCNQCLLTEHVSP